VRVGFSRLIWTRFASTNRSSAVCVASSSSTSWRMTNRCCSIKFPCSLEKIP
jgi:hypothetical protein